MHDELRLSIYKIGPNFIMKMHNHPDMFVATYILRGTMHAKTLTPTENELYDMKSRELSEKDLIAIDSEEENLHEFVGGPDGCTFIDILFPDYDETSRIFKMYDIVEEENGLYRIIET